MSNDYMETVRAGSGTRPTGAALALAALQALFIATIVASLGLRTIHSQVTGRPDESGWLDASRIALDVALALGVAYLIARGVIAGREPRPPMAAAEFGRTLRRPRALEIISVLLALGIGGWQYLEAAPGGVVRAAAPWVLVAFGLALIAALRRGSGDADG